jgi:hypothetical protein
MEETRNTCKFLVENIRGRDHLRNIGVDGKILQK